MSLALAKRLRALESAPVPSTKVTIYRVVAAACVVGKVSFEHLFTSGQRNRFNLAGAHALYASETEALALTEFKANYTDLGVDCPDYLCFRIHINLARVLDLTDPKTTGLLKLQSKSLLADWKNASRPTVTQQLGALIDSGAGNFSGVRYPSAKAAGANIAIYRKRVNPPDIVWPLEDPRKGWPLSGFSL